MSVTGIAQTSTPQAAPPPSAAPGSLPWPPRKDAHYSLFVMTIVVMFTVLDRSVFSLLIDPIKADFGISDTQAALMMGAAFSLPFGISGILVGRLADNQNRRKLVALSLAFWSLCTALCGMTQGYLSLLLGRMGIGVGEAGYGPPAWSIASDYWPRERIAFATATMGIGATVGTGLALFLGGTVLHLVSGMPPLEVPGIGVIRSWQWTFVVVGLPGLLWALVVMTSKEPQRRGLPPGQVAQKVPVRETVKWLRDDWRSYTATVGGMAIKAMMMAVPMTWNATLIHREFDWSLAKVGVVYGLVTMIVSPIALMLGAKISEVWMKKGRSDANLRIVFYGTLASVPIMAIAPQAPDPYLMIGLNALQGFIAMIGFGPSIAAFQVITPNHMRGQIGALTQFCNHVIAFGLSPLIVALFTDYLFQDDRALKYSMSLNAVIMGVIALFVIGQGLKPYARSYDRAVREFAN